MELRVLEAETRRIEVLAAEQASETQRSLQRECDRKAAFEAAQRKVQETAQRVLCEGRENGSLSYRYQRARFLYGQLAPQKQFKNDKRIAHQNANQELKKAREKMLRLHTKLEVLQKRKLAKKLLESAKLQEGVDEAIVEGFSWSSKKKKNQCANNQSVISAQEPGSEVVRCITQNSLLRSLDDKKRKDFTDDPESIDNQEQDTSFDRISDTAPAPQDDCSLSRNCSFDTSSSNGRAASEKNDQPPLGSGQDNSNSSKSSSPLHSQSPTQFEINQLYAAMHEKLSEVESWAVGDSKTVRLKYETSTGAQINVQVRKESSGSYSLSLTALSGVPSRKLSETREALLRVFSEKGLMVVSCVIASKGRQV